jgi:hypothetical protein
MQQLEPRTLPRLGYLMARFRAQVAQRDRHDGEVIDGLVRMLRRGGPEVEEFCRLINDRVPFCDAAQDGVTRGDLTQRSDEYDEDDQTRKKRRQHHGRSQIRPCPARSAGQVCVGSGGP